VSEILKKISRTNTIIRAARVLDARDRRKVLFVVILQISFGLLDLAGVAIVGILGALAVSGVQGRAPGDRTSMVLNLFNLEGFSLQGQVALLGICAAALLIGKTVFSVIFTRKILFFLSRRAAVISGELIRKLFTS
jgi:ATP-binding cassette subfamily C protein